MTDWTASIALATGIGSVVMWAVVLVREMLRVGTERRRNWWGIPALALVVSVGVLASAVASGGWVIGIDLDSTSRTALTLIASVGRGALLTAAVLMLIAPHPRWTR